MRRIPEKQVTDVARLHEVLDVGLVAHLAVVDDGQPFVIPVGYARDDDAVLVHGSTASRLFRALADGAPTCFTVTLLDGLVLARSAFNSSMHYRSAMVLGRCRVLEGEEKDRAFRVLSDHLLPGRWEHIRPPSPQEDRATLVLSLPLTEWSLKVSAAPPDDEPEDLSLPVWAGVLPLRTVVGPPQAAPDLLDGIDEPDHVRALRARAWS